MNKIMKWILVFTLTTSLFLTTACQLSPGKKENSSEKNSESSSEAVTDKSKEEKQEDSSAEKNLSALPDPSQVSAGEDLRLRSMRYEVYTDTIGYGEKGLVLDGYGHAGPSNSVGKPRIQALKDAITGEAVFYVESYIDYEKKGEYEFIEYPHSRLYDLEGNLLEDWKDVFYTAAFGDWITVSEGRDYQFTTDSKKKCYLYNVKNGQKINDVYGMYSLGRNKVFLQDRNGESMALMDRDGKMDQSKMLTIIKNSGYSYMGKYLQLIQYGSSDSQTDTYSFYDENLQLLSTMILPNMDCVGVGITIGPYINIENEEGCRICDIRGDGKGGEKILCREKSIDYYDGKVYIADQTGDGKSELFSADGRKLTDFGGKIYPEIYYYYDWQAQRQPVSTFYVMTEHKLRRIDSSGKEISGIDFPKNETLQELEIYEDAIIYTLGKKMGVLTKDLQEAIPAGEYRYINIDKDDVTGSVLLSCYQTGNIDLFNLFTLYDLQGNVLAENLYSMGLFMDGKASVVKGTKFGLMNAKGQWLVKYSIFDFVED